MTIDGGREIGDDFVDDGSSFIGIVPTFITPGNVTRFHLYERLEPSDRNGAYRFRCLLKDTSSIPESTLIRMLMSWECLYIHKQEMGNYEQYLKDNLHIILTNDNIDMEKRSVLFTDMCSDVIQGVMKSNFGFPKLGKEALASVKDLVLKAIGFISSIDSLKGLATLIGHDYETHTHSIKVGWLMAIFVKANPGLFAVSGRKELEKLAVEATVMGFLHDIGKAKVPSRVLNKNGRLNNLEYVAVQAHTAYSVSLLFDLDFPKYVMEGILYHHENEDGSGYPCRLKHDEIPLFAKICHIADVFDALTSERPYKPSKTPYEALTIMTGKNPNLEILQQMEKEVWERGATPVSVVVRNEKNPDIRRLKHESRLNKEAEKRVEARMKLRDNGMAHCFDAELLKQFVLTLNRSESFDFSTII
ncbi:MAG: HD domain-containing protein [Desulfobacteraceae bacterium]|nr:HD domain-containing protein [Desulfobacteraceae bacterium]